MKKLIAILALSLSLILCLTVCGSKMPYDLSGTASVELHAYDNDSTEPFAKIVVDGEDVATIVEMFNSLKLKEMKYTEPSINGYDFWFKDADGNELLDENGNIVGISQQEKPAETKDIVYIRKDEDGAPVGVAVQTADERFEIALKDIDNGREMTWDDAMKFKLPTKKQAAIICAYLDDINAKLKEAGGEPLDKWYWTSSESSADGAWFYTGYTGTLYGNSKNFTRSVRPVLAF